MPHVHPALVEIRTGIPQHVLESALFVSQDKDFDYFRFKVMKNKQLFLSTDFRRFPQILIPVFPCKSVDNLYFHPQIFAEIIHVYPCHPRSIDAKPRNINHRLLQVILFFVTKNE
jgi:hypothetical protein